MSNTAYSPTLDGLPEKVKQRIVDFLDELSFYDESEWEDDSDDEADGGEEGKESEVTEDGAIVLDASDFEEPEDLRKSTLSALSRVSKEWNGLVAPVFWRDLFLYPCSTSMLLELVTDILPRQGHHVDQLLFRETPFDLLLEDGPIDEPPAAKGKALEVVQACERLENVDSSLAWDHRILRARNLALAAVVKACPKLTSLDIEGSVRPMEVNTGENDEENYAAVDGIPNVALEAIKALSGSIEAFSLLLPPDGLSSEADGAELLAAFPNIKRLELNSFVAVGELKEDEKKKKRQALFSALSSLSKLEELDLGESSFVDDEFAAYPFSFPALKHLALGEYLELSFPSFVILVERFSSSLESLELDGTPHAEDDAPVADYKPLNLPKLVALELATPHPATFLRLFANSPLKEVLLGECPQFSVTEVVAFLEAHKETLVDVDVEDEGMPDEEKEGAEPVTAVEVIAKWCEENGKNFALLPSSGLEAVDSDDEEEEAEE
ncbi:hypothetical protein JCM8547_007086 [Rhodosporidiobolus lusitaniae]